MNSEKEVTGQVMHSDPELVGKNIHPTHFSVQKTSLRNSDYDSGYEWIDMGSGHFKRVPKKTKDES
ncbi:MAG: hypothetical protein UT58_C0043G0003 [Microgenomates group bacterium GW2011_GWC1_39_7b]|uniref:Uncharacterized protein n=3 Tax=Candidatus Woeseibacteriota TaxID=1752722 RepID=A0A0G0PQT1_9BACT|nr:MAG: hypothetical protein UT17_C0004G0054 [Candidatus Woesebacteria bacterium GW2011_GWB1_39_10]KKR25559.1 MAG: hypothetical protein UT58_C0043G0003 [Microgenomates group bacterium GW2011_GWC1_39_7b]KKR73675.1 MAG: hypothetical protein UU16_C0016G0018 [Candidatus Woesebacteria bacterium GW2011_GWA2_40_7]KKS90698.1 MAG: hypothetical protein UV66_C0001G0055 [Candidatus Woesebacteria bacterium GW2011_GWA1_43_12]